jgi:hypothetical protein
MMDLQSATVANSLARLPEMVVRRLIAAACELLGGIDGPAAPRTGGEKHWQLSASAVRPRGSAARDAGVMLDAARDAARRDVCTPSPVTGEPRRCEGSPRSPPGLAVRRCRANRLPIGR